MEEIWKIIPFAPDYEASSLGEIRSNKNGKVSAIKQSLQPSGYFSVSLRVDGGYITKRVHRIIAETFIPNPENKPQVNHKRPMKTYNFVCNLEWATAQENILHAFRFGLTPRRKGEESLIAGGKHYCAKGVLNQQTGIFYDTVKEAARAHNMKYSTLRAMLNGYRDNRTQMIAV